MKFTQRGIVLLVVVGMIAGSWGCGKQEPVATTNPTVAEKTQEIAADKTLTAEVMRQSFARGVFDDAFALAMQDSGLAEAAWATLAADPRFASRIVTQQSTAATSGSSQRSGRTTTSTASPTPRKDVLDQTEDAAKKANERLDQAGRVKKEAEEAKKKIDDILKP